VAFGEETFKRVLKAELAETLDLHSTFQWEHFLGFGLDAYFLARAVELDGTQVLVRASDFWRQVDYKSPYEGVLTLPRDKRAVSIYSRRAFAYPQLIAYVKLPSLSLVGDETQMFYYLGVEHGSAYYNGIASFVLVTSTTYTNMLQVVVGPLGGASSLVIDVAKPADFNTSYHVYRVVTARNLVLFLIDGRLRAVAIQCLQGGNVNVKSNVLPYSITLIPPMPSTLTAFIELSAGVRTSVATSDVTAPLSPYRFRVSDGKDIVPLSLPLYLDNSDTALAGYSISSGSVTSHPIPMFGYTRKTLRFMADQAGSLEVQVYTLSGNWRSYDSISIPANTLLSYSVDDEVILARTVYTPTGYPATVLEAEVSMS
jgi:hypothetical protein